MSLMSFFKLVGVQAKVASLFPFLIGLLFAFYRYGEINMLNIIIFFACIIIFDMTTTAINHYMDYQKATNDHDFDYRKERNVIGQYNMSEKAVKIIIWVLLISASLLGLWLVYLTHILVLFIGIICFLIGIFYTFGPIPISRLPLGEVFSGITMGFGIIFLIVYVNSYHLDIITSYLLGASLVFQMNLIEMGIIFLISLPSVFTIANLMLANNIRDLEEDIANKRYTLPYYIGRKGGIILFESLYYASYLAIIAAVVIGIYPPLMSLALITFLLVGRSLIVFRAKRETTKIFNLATQNLILINGGIVICLALIIWL